jgi:Glyoxalase-like domain
VRHDEPVSSYVSHTTMDCADAYALSVWWQGVLDYGMDPVDPNEAGHEECLIISPDGHHRLLFIQVPEGKQVKNRIHLDLRPREGTRDDELARLLAHGATEVSDHRQPDGRGWVVLADPEGNEFCILRSEAEVAARDVAAG